jgi:hypothetical protein
MMQIVQLDILDGRPVSVVVNNDIEANRLLDFMKSAEGWLDKLGEEPDQRDGIIRGLATHLSCIMDYAGEGNCSRLVGFGHAYREAKKVLDAAYDYMEPDAEAEHLAELNRGYAQDRI